MNRMISWDSVCNFNRTVFGQCLDAARKSLSLGHTDEGLAWCSLAAWWAWNLGFSGELASKELESLLSGVAQTLPRGRESGPVARRRFLHVFDEAYNTGGHTALCARWIQVTGDTAEHCVLLTSQRGSVPPKLEEAARRSQGLVITLDPRSSLLERAVRLRQECLDRADVVVLHTHPDNVLASVALGVAGGPPVIMVNHADHVFHLGRAVSDLVIDIRDSGHAWSVTQRGVVRARIVPIPLDDDANGERESDSVQRMRTSTRRALGLAKDAIVLLTIGAEYKYEPTDQIDYLRALEPVLQRFAHVHLLAIGPHSKGRWKALQKSTGGRVIALGNQQGMERFHSAADIYLEGFPMGSLTAMLEAGMAGLPCVRTPAVVPPPYCSDGVAFAQIPQAGSWEEYERLIAGLVEDAQLRATAGRELRARILEHHCGENWIRQLKAALECLPQAHTIGTVRPANSVPPVQRDYWLTFLHVRQDSVNIENALVQFFTEAAIRGLRPDREFCLTSIRRMRECRARIYADVGGGEKSINGKLVPLDLDRDCCRIREAVTSKVLLRQVTEAFENGDFATVRRYGLAGILRKPKLLRDRGFCRALTLSLLGCRLSAVVRRLVRLTRPGFVFSPDG